MKSAIRGYPVDGQAAVASIFCAMKRFDLAGALAAGSLEMVVRRLRWWFVG